jgi:PAS domain S-box-containing protein
VHPVSGAELLSRELHQRGEQFKTLLDRAPLGVYLIDARFRIREVNPIARVFFGNVTGHLIGKSFPEIIHILWQETYADELVRIFRNTLQTGDSYVAADRKEYRIDRQRYEVYDWRVDRIVLPDGQHGLVCYFRDVGQQVATREALHEADRRKNEFLATLAHELRNPLAPLRNGLKLLEASSDPAVQTQARTMMERQLAHMVRLIDDLMDVSRITRDKIELHKELIALDKVIRQAIETSRPLIESHGNILTTDMRRQQITVDGDAIRLTQVFCNLLNNAAKYSEPGGHIDLELVREGDEAVARVRDHGRGIPPEMLTKVFDLFVQVDQPLERSGGGGLGIGLSLVRRLIEMHGGAVEAHSDGPGTGSEFIVRLPISPSEMPVTPKPQSIDVSASPARRRVLIVDDNEDASESLALVLRLMGHEIATASDGLAALNIAKSFLPELILLDIGMPALNGYETAARIREQPWSRGVRLVALTGWGQDADRKRSAEAGFDLHLVKPIDPAEIERLLADLPLA